jgi:integrase
LEDDKFDSYLNKYYKQIIQFKEHDNTSYLFKIFDFVEFLIKKADEKHTKNPIKKSTLKEYLRIMFSYCFHYIVIEGALTNEVYNEIREKINIFADESLYIQNSNITTRTTNVYYRLIKLFWKRYTNFKTEASLKMIVDIRRSVVFEDEIDSFIEILKTKEFTAPTKDIKFKKTIKPVFCLLLFYSGLRKTELRTLLTKNIELVNNEEFEIIVSKENFKLTSKANNELELHEKSDSAIRKVRFSIKNQKHLKLIKQYVHFLEKNQIKFTFPAISIKENIKKSKPITNDFINELPRKLSEHTGRYTPLHSLRHSYATFKALSLYAEDEHFLVYELCKLIGHSEPAITLENYIHIDLLFILKEIIYPGRIPNLSSSYQLDIV